MTSSKNLVLRHWVTALAVLNPFLAYNLHFKIWYNELFSELKIFIFVIKNINNFFFIYNYPLLLLLTIQPIKS